MYKFKTNEKIKLLQGRTITYVAKKIGITPAFLTAIFNNKRNCSKTVAYAIVKCLHQEAEILDYFDFIKKGE